MTAITSWIPEVQGSVLGAPKTVLKSAIVRACRDFCHKTELWYEELTAIDIEASTSAYPLTSSNGDIISVEHVEIDDVPLEPTTEEYLDKNGYKWRTQTEATPLRYYTNVAREINLVYTPSVANAGALAVWVNLKPSESATTVEDFIWEDHRNIITYGAKAQLLGMTAMPWGDLKQSIIFQTLFDEAVADAATLKESGYNSEGATLTFELG